jgi:acetyltransferase-like isoleucine patch superfamily enzyme
MYHGIVRRLLRIRNRRQVQKLGVALGAGAEFIGMPIVTVFPGSIISIGANARLISDSRKTALAVNHPVVLRTLSEHARLEIAEDVGISGGSICAGVSVIIGPGTMLGANVTIMDTDFHPLAMKNRRYKPMPEGKPTDRVAIGANVFIGTNAIILKGTTIADDCVIGAGAVVRGDIASGSVVAGNPATVVRRLSFP